MPLDDTVVRPSGGARRTIALEGLLWVVVLAATFLAIGAIVYVAYVLLEATRPG